MALSGVLVDTQTISSGVTDLTRNTYVAQYQNGYMLRIDRVFENSDINLKIDAETSLCFVLGSLPSEITWTLQDTETEIITNGSFSTTNTTRTYTGRPKDGNGNPIGADQFFMVEKELSQPAGLTPQISSALAITPVTLDQIMYGV